jgi:uncharacterized protein (DUF1810 family)
VSVASDGDPHDLERFVQAQAGTYDQALSEIRSGRKQSHWMWFVFPQLEGLGNSAMSKRYAIRSLGEAARCRSGMQYEASAKPERT